MTRTAQPGQWEDMAEVQDLRPSKHTGCGTPGIGHRHVAAELVRYGRLYKPARYRSPESGPITGSAVPRQLAAPNGGSVIGG